MMNGHGNSDFNLLVSSKSRREVVRIRKDATLQKALEPLLKKWGLNPNKVSYQLRYYRYDLKSGTLAGDTEGTEVYITKHSEPPDRELKGFHPFINKSSIKTCTQEYTNRNGWYLTRESSSANGQFSLAVTFKNELRHFKINFSPPDGTYKVASKPFDNLHDLFEYYQTHAIKTTSEGEIYLTHPIPKESKAIPKESKAENGPHPSIQSLPVREEPKLSAQNGFKHPQSSRPLPPLPDSPSNTSPPPILPEKPVPQPKKLPSHPKESLVNKNAPIVNNTKPNIRNKKNSNTLPHPRKVSKDSDPTTRPLPAIPPPNEEQGNHSSNPRLIPGSGQYSGSKLEKKSKQISNGFPSLTVNTENAKSWNNLSNILPSPNSCDGEQWKPPNLSPIPSFPTRPSKAPPKLPPSQSIASGSSQRKEEAPEVPSRISQESQPLKQPHFPKPSNINNTQPKPKISQPIDPMQDKLRHKNSLPNPPVIIGTGPPSDDKLPPNWVHVYSNSRGRFYYFNQATSETKWTHPLSGKEAASNGAINKARPDSPSEALPDSGRVQYSRQRSNTVNNKPKDQNSPPISKSFTPLEKKGDKNLTRHASDGIQEIKRQNYSPEPSSPLERVLNKSKSFRATENKTNIYDVLPEFEPSTQSNSSPVPPLLNVQNTRPKRQAPPSPGYHSPPASSSDKMFPLNKKQPTNSAGITKDASFKHSAPVNSIQFACLPQGKPIKVGKHTIPAPPPNIPSTNCTSCSTPPRTRHNPKPEGKSITLPRGDLLASITNAANGKILKPVAHVQQPKTDSNNTLLGVLREQMDARKGMIQDSDDSDSSFEDADDDAWSVHNDN